MKLCRLPKLVTFGGCLAACLPAAVAQNSILLLNNSVVEPAPYTTSITDPYIFQSTIQELSCPTTGIYANLSSVPSTQSTGNQGLIALDTIIVTVTPPQGVSNAPVNVCPLEYTPPGQACFNPATVGMHGEVTQANPDIGQDLDLAIPGFGQTFYQYYGVPAISIASQLQPGPQSVEFQLENILPPAQSDMGNSTLYLNTNCTSLGVSGPATIINNPPPGNPTNPVTETFVFNSATDQGVNFQYTVPPNIGDLTGLTEHVTDYPVDPASFDTTYTYGTSFSTSSCYLHAGELLNNNAACKMYTLLCSVGTDPTATGALCPASAAADEIFGEAFDPPLNFTLNLPDISTPNGTYHTGVGLLMGPDAWATGSSNGCQYTAGSTAATSQLLCPQNLLYNFFGPGASNSQGRGSNVNSTFVTVYGVPEPLTTVTLTNGSGSSLGVGPANGYWTNNTSPYARLSSTPPIGVNTLSNAVLAGAPEFVAAPIQNISYGLTAPSGNVPQPQNEPIAADTTLAANTACPTAGSSYTAAPFTAPLQPLSLNEGDGNYTLHYYAQDCAGTQELEFLLNSQVNPPSWYTTFYTYPIKLDTVAPAVAVALSPTGGSYSYGQAVSANYSCSDSGSGLASCGSTTYGLSNGTGKANSGQLSATVPTTTLGGSLSYTVTGTDFAGNTQSQSAQYSVGKATLTVTATNLNMTTGTSVPTLTYGVTGFVNGDTAGVLSGSPSLLTTATSSSSAGNYPITITQGTLSAANYNFVFVNGTLSVVAPSVAIITTNAVITGTAATGYTLTISVTNSGTAAATNVTLTSATLGTTSGTPVVKNIGTVVAGGGTGSFTVKFAGSAGGNGAGVAEKYAGTYGGGSFSTSLRSVTLP
jgi:hypothetical protein